MTKNKQSNEDIRFQVFTLIDDIEGELSAEEEQRIRALINTNTVAYEYFVEFLFIQKCGRMDAEIRQRIIDIVEDAAAVGNMAKDRLKNPDVVEYLKKFRK